MLLLNDHGLPRTTFTFLLQLLNRNIYILCKIYRYSYFGDGLRLSNYRTRTMFN